MPLDRIPLTPLTPDELAELEAMLPPDGVCRICGRWECLDCGVMRGRRNRFSENPQYCPSCKSLNGQMLPSRHRDPVEHFVSFMDATSKGLALRYPVATPIPAAAQTLIHALSEVVEQPVVTP